MTIAQLERALKENTVNLERLKPGLTVEAQKEYRMFLLNHKVLKDKLLNAYRKDYLKRGNNERD